MASIARKICADQKPAADESLKFWKLFERKPGSTSAMSREGGIGGKGKEMAKQMTIR